jgi:hypothetical protein
MSELASLTIEVSAQAATSCLSEFILGAIV